MTNEKYWFDPAQANVPSYSNKKIKMKVLFLNGTSFILPTPFTDIEKTIDRLFSQKIWLFKYAGKIIVINTNQICNIFMEY